ncbi:MAG: hypothetical protein ABL888_11285 [Pirellulaceae bacterium]
MAKADNAGQVIAQTIDKWRVAIEKLLQTLDNLATYADMRQVNSIFYYETEGDKKLFHDLLETRKAFAKSLKEGADNLLAQVGELYGLQVTIMPRLVLARNELSKLHGLAGGYQYTWTKLEPLAYAMRRWAVEFSHFWRNERIAFDLEFSQAFEQKRASCPWNPVHSKDIRRHFADELSQLLRDLGTHPPLVINNGDSKKTMKEKGAPEKYSPENCEQVATWWKKFRKNPELNGFKRNPNYRKASHDHFVEWGKFQKLPKFPENTAEARAILRSHRYKTNKRQATKSTKTKRTKFR